MRLLAFILLLLCLTPTHAETLDYINQSGSMMSVTIDGDTVKGEYITSLGCDIGIPKPLVGWINGTAITFTVNFGECQSITSWVGHIRSDGSISTIWTLAKANSGWNQKMTGVSEFTLVTD